MIYDTNRIDQRYDIIRRMYEGYYHALGVHPDVCESCLFYEAGGILDDILDGERYTYAEALDCVIRHSARPIEDCRGCSCGRHQEVDGVVLNLNQMQWVTPDPETILTTCLGSGAPALVDLAGRHDHAVQAFEIYRAINPPPECWRWFREVLYGARRAGSPEAFIASIKDGSFGIPF